MMNATTTDSFPPPVAHKGPTWFFSSRFGEALGIVLGLCALTLTIALLSFHPDDVAWSVSSPTGPRHNAVGIVGANLADALFQGLGLLAYGLPVLLGWHAVQVFRGKALLVSAEQATGLCGFLLSLAGLLSLFQELPLFYDRIRLGGFIGFALERWLESALNPVGAGLLLSGTAVLSLMLATTFSPRRWLRRWWQELPFNRDKPAPETNDHTATVTTNGVHPLSSARQRAKANGATPSPETTEDKGRDEQRIAEALYGDEAPGIVSPVKRTPHGIPAIDLETPATPPAMATPGAGAPIEHPLPATPPVAPPVPAAAASQPQPEPPQGPVSEVRRLAREAIERRNSGNNPLIRDKDRDKNGSPAEVSAARRRLAAAEQQLAANAEQEVAKMVQAVHIVRRQLTPPTPMPAVPAGPPAAGPRPVSTGAAAAAAAAARAVEETVYALPAVEMLTPAPPQTSQSDEELRARARLLAEKCREFNVIGEILEIEPGPVVTTFGFKPDPGVKYSRVAGLVDDLCLGLQAESVRIDRLPGKATIGIEVPNTRRDTIYLREIIESDVFRDNPGRLPIALGKTINGEPYATDLAKMPHLLIAGSTGSGKSVMINSLICSILFKSTANDVRLIMVDPKRVELELYAGIPHLLTPIITDPKRAANALNWAVGEMENRYKLLASVGVRNIEGFNRAATEAPDPMRFPDGPPPRLPYIVIIIDELADLMMVASNEVETAIARLAQMARAVGIHLVIATQRPSVDVITGLIKANFPARISFRVSSKVDSRTILDTNGAEQLLGQGDMLFSPGSSRLIRIHGAYVSETEINRITDFIKQQGAPQYDESVQMSEEEVEAAEAGVGERDALYDEAVRIVVQMGKASTSVLQRRLRIGYGRAAAILDMMEREGFIGPIDGSRPRVVKQAAYDYVEMLDGHALMPEEDE
ncbi:DNA translocase FtsK [Chloracidobacterium sp. MS 40/45]|uniref:DNA translocase FtsK n=1 Tax=Chloracidobacterium aggregatum TaxID=2851959 RepID=UPI001B8B6542|nr:DNA translocase FtsK [Chloracidobacterium aggregatum]QUW01452.1 DNA translocase FtsK [Chloracidobacterium sp. MS 40/45]